MSAIMMWILSRVCLFLMQAYVVTVGCSIAAALIGCSSTAQTFNSLFGLEKRQASYVIASTTKSSHTASLDEIKQMASTIVEQREPNHDRRDLIYKAVFRDDVWSVVVNLIVYRGPNGAVAMSQSYLVLEFSKSGILTNYINGY